MHAEHDDLVAGADPPALEHAHADPAAPDERVQQARPLQQVLQVVAGVAGQHPRQPRAADPELEAEQALQLHAARHEVAAQQLRLQSEVVGGLRLDDRELLLAPARVAPVPGRVA